MAENESKPERKQIEMSIWFVILLVVVIVFMCVFMSMNKKLGEAQDLISKHENTISALNNESERKTDLINELSKLASDGDLSTRNYYNKLKEYGFDPDAEVPSPAEVSGDIITSGEVVE